MKNIHILPTDKPSRLVKIKDNLFYTTTENIPGGVYQHIYITSDEKAKEGDWGYIPFQGGNVKLVGKYFADDWKKIILTTDQDLIEDGVQAIDDEFLEWFVKNPSCEEVEVKDVFKSSPIGFGNAFDYYKIIIPKEEREQETLEDIKLEEVFGSDYCKFSVVENKLAILYRNQEQLLKAIKLLSNEK